MNMMLSRLGVVQDLQQTSNSQKAETILLETLQDGIPAIIWADMFSLSYNALPYDDRMWGMQPIIVFGCDLDENEVWISDRARVPLIISTKELTISRSRVKKYKHRQLTLSPPQHEKLRTAVHKGIWDTIKLFTEAPPKGSRNNFGLAAYQWWADLLTNPKQRMSWEREFPAGPKMYSGLTNAFSDIMVFGKDGQAERDVYAEFLDEAAIIMEKPSLSIPADLFRQSGRAWDELANALLPKEAAPFSETRELLLRRHHIFLDQGCAALPEIKSINTRLKEIKAAVELDFPLSGEEVYRMRQELRNRVMLIHDIEKEAITSLQSIM
jgi:hypothetical protein